MKAKEKYEYCLGLTKAAISAVEVIEGAEKAEKLLRFAKDYWKDAEYCATKGDYETALEAIAYAHGFIDAGVLAGFFRIPGYHLTED